MHHAEERNDGIVKVDDSIEPVGLEFPQKLLKKGDQLTRLFRLRFLNNHSFIVILNFTFYLLITVSILKEAKPQVKKQAYE